jgi:hypothetical protein
MSESNEERAAVRLAATPFAAVYPLYLNKVVRKGRTQAELDAVIGWLTGFDAAALAAHLEAKTTFAGLFEAAELPAAASLVTGTVCGVRVEEVAHPLMRRIRILDKLVDELAKGRPLSKVLRDGGA